MPHASEEAEKRALEAVKTIERGDLNAAHRLLREATSLDNGNSAVKAAWEKLQAGDSHVLQSLCEKFVASEDEDDAEAILDHLTSNVTSTPTSLGKAMEILLQYKGDIDAIDQVTSQLLTQLVPQQVLAATLLENPTTTFNRIFERGDDSMEAQTQLLLDTTAWNNDKDRVVAMRDVLQLALAQLMKAGQDFPDRAMKCISHLLGKDAKNLNGLIDADGFEVILDNLDCRLPAKLRSQASLACLKLLELSPDNAKVLISQYVVQHVQKPTGDRLIQAFSAAAAVFPMASDSASELFLSDGFLPSFVKIVTNSHSQRVEQAALDLLNAACMDKKCRAAIRKYCPQWLDQMSSGYLPNQTQRRQSQVATANLVLQKINALTLDDKENVSQSAVEDAGEQEERVSSFIDTVKVNNAGRDSDAVSKAVEGLAYASTQPTTKVKLAQDHALLKRLISVIEDKSNASMIFGVLTILANLTHRRPVLSEEQKKLSQLKAYANASKPAPADPLEDDSAVNVRCKNVLAASVMPCVNKLAPRLTKASLSLSVQIINSIAFEKTSRGVLAQQGAIRSLLYAYDQGNAEPGHAVSYTAAHAIARILISVNPHHAFGSTPPLTSAIRPLASLLSENDDAPVLSPTAPSHQATRTLLPTFEALLALTNLASVSAETCETIVRSAWPAIQDVLLSSNTLVQRAAAELVCNLCGSPAGASRYTGAQANGNLKVLLALADAEDMSTRRASAGALAMLTEWDEVVGDIVKQEDDKGVKRLVALMEDENAEVVIRGAVALKNAIGTQGGVGKDAMAALKRVDTLDERLEKIYQNGDDGVKEEIGAIAAILGGQRP